MRKNSALTTRRAATSASPSRLALIAATVFGFSLAASPNALGATHHKKTESHAAAHHSTTRHVATLRSGTSHHEVASRNDHHSVRVVSRHGHVEYVSERGDASARNALTGPAYMRRVHAHYRMAVAHYRHSYLQCVPYAREVSHIELTGNAFLWWAEAAGRYARGNSPQEGAVLNFRAIGRMPLGHVAVVTSVIDNRTILVTQANWVPGTITNDVTMEDVSANNDWSEVQVELGDSSKWGAAYPTYGFIYNHPDTVIASNGSTQNTEVAEAPAARTIAQSAPDRDLQ
jgi:surface antigen